MNIKQTNSPAFHLTGRHSVLAIVWLMGMIAFQAGVQAEQTVTEDWYAYDSNGNVTLLTNAEAKPTAHYEYDAFGKTIAATGPAAETNTYRFSTKPIEDTNGLAFYGYRYYAPELGRWPSKDPIEEDGGLNMYLITGNNVTNSWDRFGLDPPGLSWLEHDPLIQPSATVPPCNINIYFGHAGQVPQGTIGAGPCAAAHVVACGGEGADHPTRYPGIPYRDIPGAPPAATGTTEISIADAAVNARDAFDAAKLLAPSFCGKTLACDYCSCTSVTITISCHFGWDLEGRLAVPGDICGKSVNIPCTAQ